MGSPISNSKSGGACKAPSSATKVDQNDKSEVKSQEQQEIVKSQERQEIRIKRIKKVWSAAKRDELAVVKKVNMTREHEPVMPSVESRGLSPRGWRPPRLCSGGRPPKWFWE